MLAAKLGARISLPTLYQTFCPPFALPTLGLMRQIQPSLQPAGAAGTGEMRYGLGSCNSSKQTGKQTTENMLYGPVQTFYRLKYAQLHAQAWGHILPSEKPGAGREHSLPKPDRQTRTLFWLCSFPRSYCGFLSEKKHKWGGKRCRMRGGHLPPLPTSSGTWKELLNCCALPFSHLQDRNDNNHCLKRRE